MQQIRDYSSALVASLRRRIAAQTKMSPCLFLSSDESSRWCRRFPVEVLVTEENSYKISFYGDGFLRVAGPGVRVPWCSFSELDGVGTGDCWCVGVGAVVDAGSQIELAAQRLAGP